MGNSASSLDPPVVQSVDRAFAVMDILARDGWSSVTGIAAQLGIHKSTVFRLLATLERRGLTEQHPQTQKYRLGPGVARFASAGRAAGLTDSARPVCERLSDSTGETVNLAVLADDEVVYIDQVNRSPSVVSVDWLGRRAPLHASSNGKVFLAHLPPAEREAFLARPLARLTGRTVTDPQALRGQLERIRADGYGAAVQELEVGLTAVAAAVRGPLGDVVATICVSAPSYRLLPGRVPAVGVLTRQAGEEVSRRLGFPGGVGAR